MSALTVLAPLDVAQNVLQLHNTKRDWRDKVDLELSRVFPEMTPVERAAIIHSPVLLSVRQQLLASMRVESQILALTAHQRLSEHTTDFVDAVVAGAAPDADLAAIQKAKNGLEALKQVMNAPAESKGSTTAVQINNISGHDRDWQAILEGSSG